MPCPRQTGGKEHHPLSTANSSMPDDTVGRSTDLCEERLSPYPLLLPDRQARSTDMERFIQHKYP